MPHNTPKNRTLQLPTNSTSFFSAYRHNTSRRLRKVDFLSHYIHMRRAAHIVWLLLAVLVRQSGLCALLPGTVLPPAALATPPAPLSGNRSDTVQHVELSFRFDRSLLDSAYRDNSSALHTLRNWLGPSCCASRIDSIGIFSYSSMEGYGWHNGQLARDRGRAVKGYLVWKYPHLNQYRIYIHPQGEDWAGLLRRLSDMPDLPSRDQIANLFDTGLSEEELKNRFRILIDSQSYRYLQSTLFPSLRRAIVRIYWKDSVPDVLTAGIRSDAFSAAIADAPEKEVIYTAEEKPPLHGSATPQTTPPQPALPPVPASLPETAPPRPLRPEPPAPPQRLLHRPLPHPLTSHPFHRSDKTTLASGRIPRPPAGQSKPTFYIGRHSPPTSKPNSAWATVGR